MTIEDATASPFRGRPSQPVEAKVAVSDVAGSTNRPDELPSDPVALIGGTGDGTASAAQAQEGHAGHHSVTAASPLFVRAGCGEAEQVTILVEAQADDDGRVDLPSELQRALKALAAEHGDKFKNLATSQMGSSLMETRLVYRVDSDLLPELEAAAAGFKHIDVAPLDDVINARRVGKYSSATKKGLASGGLVRRTSAMLTLRKALADGGDAVPDDRETRKDLAYDLLTLASSLVDLFNATLFDIAREGEDAVDAYLEAGGTPDFQRIGQLIFHAAETLDLLDTKLGEALLSKMVPHGNGLVFDYLAARPDLAMKLATLLADTVSDRLAQTLANYDTPRRQLPEEIYAVSGGGSYRSLPGNGEAAARYERDPEYPLTELATEPLAFLGSDLGEDVRAKVVRVLAEADAAQPAMRAADRQEHIEDRVDQVERMLEDETFPDGDREARIADIVARERESAAKQYDKIHALTIQRDVYELFYRLVHLNGPTSGKFSLARAAAESALIIRDALDTVSTPSIHRHLADAAVELLTSRSGDDQIASDPQFQAAASALSEKLLQGGPDGEIPPLVATRLAPIGSEEAMGRRRAHTEGDAEGDYVLEADAETLIQVESFLVDKALPDHEASQALDFIRRPDAAEIIKGQRYRNSDHPNAEGVLAELQRLGEAATKSIAAIVPTS